MKSSVQIIQLHLQVLGHAAVGTDESDPDTNQNHGKEEQDEQGVVP